MQIAAVRYSSSEALSRKADKALADHEGENSHPRTPPRAQILEIAPAKPSALLAAMVVLATSSGCPKVVTLGNTCQLSSHMQARSGAGSTHSNMFRPAPTAGGSTLVSSQFPHGRRVERQDLRNKLLNLTGFFSSGGGATRPAGADIIWEWLSVHGP